MPIESTRWCHNGGDRDYPVPVVRADESAAAWSELCGVVNTADAGDYMRLSARDIEGEMARLAPTGGAAA